MNVLQIEASDTNDTDVRETAVIIANSKASRVQEHLPGALKRLSEHLQTEVCEPAFDDESERKLKENLAKADRIIVVGGDGTLHHLLPVLLEQSKPFGILPLGTANDFARSIGVSDDINAACDIASGDRLRSIDVGVLNGRPFINVASLGIATTISQLQTSERKQKWKVLSYAVSLVEAVSCCKPFRATITSTDRPQFKGIVLQTSVGNGRYHGGGLTSGPDAQIDDGLLHIYTVTATRWWQLLHVIPALLFGLHNWASGITSFSAADCVVSCRSPQRANVDGELLADKNASYSFEVMREALRVYS